MSDGKFSPGPWSGEKRYHLPLTEAELGFLAGMLFQLDGKDLAAPGLALAQTVLDKVRKLSEQALREREGTG